MAHDRDRAARRRWLDGLLAVDDQPRGLAERVQEWIDLAWPAPRDCGAWEEFAAQRPCEPELSLSTRLSWRDPAGRPRRRRLRCVRANLSLPPGECELRLRPAAPEGTCESLILDRLLSSSLAGAPSGSVQAVLDLPGGPGRAAAAQAALQAARARLDEPELTLVDGDVVEGEAGTAATAGERRLEWEARSAVSLAARVLSEAGRSLEGLRCIVRGAGAGALSAARALAARGARVVALGDEEGALLAEEGLGLPQLEAVRRWRLSRGRPLIGLAARRRSLRHRPWPVAWAVPCEALFSFAGRAELGPVEAHGLAERGLRIACEGAPFSFTPEASIVLRETPAVSLLPSFLSTAGAARLGPGERSEDDLEDRVRELHDRCLDLAAGSSLEVGAARVAWRSLVEALGDRTGG